MKRFLFTFFAAVSLLMFVPVTVVWVRSYWIGDTIHLAWWNVAAENRWELEWDFSRGGMRAGYYHQYFPDRAEFVMRVLDDRDAGLPDAAWKTPKAVQYPAFLLTGKKTNLGFGFFHDPNFPGDGNPVVYEVIFPTGVLAGIFALLPACWLIGAWRARRSDKRMVGHCSHCGYDLRASKEICPECGSPVSQTRVTEAPLRRQRRQEWRVTLWGVVSAVALGGLAVFGAVHYWNVQREALKRQQHFIDLGIALLRAVDERDRPGKTANLGEICRLLDAGADPRFVMAPNWRQVTVPRMNWGPPLCLSACCGDLEAVKFLLSRGADINGREGRDMPPLICAASWARPEMVRYLLDHGANVNARSERETALGAAAGLADLPMVQELLAAGADPNITGDDGTPPMIKTLVSYPTDFPMVNPIANALISHGADINAPDSNGATPLLRTITAQDWELARKFIELGADVNAADKNGQTPLFLAHQFGNGPIEQLLREHGAKK